MNWTKVWSKKYPILNEYKKKENIEKYNEQMKELLEKIKEEYKVTAQDAVLILKDILYHEYLKMKKNKV